MDVANKGHLIVVDDDLEIQSLLQLHLQRAGYLVSVANDGKQLFNNQEWSKSDMIILDVMLPGEDGFSICKRIRQTSQIPLIMLTASADEADKVIGLELGADDYLGKPFSTRELLARIKALLRRSNNHDLPCRYLYFDKWCLDNTERLLIRDDGQQDYLSGADYKLLHLFLSHPNQVLDRDTISEATKGRESSPYDRSIDVHISRLRKRLGDTGKTPKLIQTIRGEGYILTTNVSNSR